MLRYSININSSIKPIRNVPSWLSSQIQIIRNQHVDTKSAESPAPFESFQDMIKERRLQAKRSIFVESPGDANSVKELTTYCSRLGRIQNLFSSEAGPVDAKAFFLVEFDSASVATDIIRASVISRNHLADEQVRIKSRFLYFNPKNEVLQQPSQQIDCKSESNVSDRDSIVEALRNQSTIDDQITTLYNVNRVSDLSYRLRFLTALQIEEAVSGLFTGACVLPFGSSVNGFGRMECDLDMCLVSYGDRPRTSQFSSIELDKSDDMKRENIKSNLLALSGITRQFLRGATSVKPVFNARVPIFEYFHRLTQLECDLTMDNCWGFQGSEILYSFGELDDRVRPLVFFLRAWAKEFDIIQSSRSLGFSNFMLTCSAIFFLQRLPQPILPPSNAFMDQKPTGDDKLPYIFKTTKLDFKSENTSTLAELVLEFFEFYRTFDYDKDAASITTGTITAKNSEDSICIYHPLEESRNVCLHVSNYVRNQFIEVCTVSHKALSRDKMDVVGLFELGRKM